MFTNQLLNSVQKISILLFFFCNLFSQISEAQYTNNIWCFGDSAGINFNGSSVPVTSTEIAQGSTVSISDSTGNLVCYAYTYYHGIAGNATLVKNKYGTLIQNGSNIVGESWYHELVLIPDPGNDSILFLFSVGETGSSLYGLYYSVINYKLNNDSGIVISKNNQLRSEPAFDGLTAIKHGNGKFWWIVSQKWDNINLTPTNDYYIYMIENNNISPLPTQNIGPNHITGGGDVSFNSEGSQFVHADWRGLIELYDFDRCTGTISNPQLIEPDRGVNPFPYYGGCQFSPNGRYLYVTSYQNIYDSLSLLYQYDLTASNISASRQVIYQFPSLAMAPAGLRKGPDGKIYLSCSFEGPGSSYPYSDTTSITFIDSLSVINQPDSFGIACDFLPFSFYLGGGQTYYGLPNNPDYTLGALAGSPCDTITAVHEIKNTIHEPNTLKIFFHPDWDIAFINADKLSGKKYALSLFDITGKLIFKEEGNLTSQYFTKDLSMQSFAKGVYIGVLQTEKEKLNTKFIK